MDHVEGKEHEVMFVERPTKNAEWLDFHGESKLRGHRPKLVYAKCGDLVSALINGAVTKELDVYGSLSTFWLYDV